MSPCGKSPLSSSKTRALLNSGVKVRRFGILCTPGLDYIPYSACPAFGVHFKDARNEMRDARCAKRELSTVKANAIVGAAPCVCLERALRAHATREKHPPPTSGVAGEKGLAYPIEQMYGRFTRIISWYARGSSLKFLSKVVPRCSALWKKNFAPCNVPRKTRAM